MSVFASLDLQKEKKRANFVNSCFSSLCILHLANNACWLISQVFLLILELHSSRFGSLHDKCTCIYADKNYSDKNQNYLMVLRPIFVFNKMKICSRPFIYIKLKKDASANANTCKKEHFNFDSWLVSTITMW